MKLGGYLISESGERDQLKTITAPDETDVLQFLEIVRDKTCVLAMKNNACDEDGPQKLTLYMEPGRYMLLLADTDEDGDPEIRTLHGKNKLPGLENMLGEPFPSQSIVDDFDLVIAAFCEYLNSGNVSTDFLY